MKKILSTLTVFTLLFTFSIPAFAATASSTAKNTSFEISLDEAIAIADSSDIQTKNGVTTIPITLAVNDDVYAELVIKVNDLSRQSAKSFSMEGWFRLNSNKEIVTVYGLDGTFEYSGTKATSTGASAYHNSAASGWEGTYSTSEEEGNDGSASITGNYTCLHNDKVNNSSSCKAKCSKSGSITFSGNYDESTIF